MPPSDARLRQPYDYRRRELREPGWRRLPGFRNTTVEDWRDAKWQRQNSVTSVRELSAAFGRYLPEDLARSIDTDRQSLATMGTRVTPHVLNTMNEHDLWSDPIRRYVLPAAAEREPVWHTHPRTRRDNLRENEMSVVEGLVWRYPTKALIELASTCPVYCGHCTRLDLVGPSVPAVKKHHLVLRASDRFEQILSYLASTPSIRDVVLSGGDLANVDAAVLERFVSRIVAMGHVRAIRLATKGLVVLPQHFLQAPVLRAFERMARLARDARIELAVHTHANHAASVTPLVAEATARLYDAGVRAVRNQAVLMKGINATTADVLDLCFSLSDEAQIAPYYLFMGDLIPHGEHWRTRLSVAQEIQDEIMGYLSGFATPRIACDVPYVGKRSVHQVKSYDRVLGISRWTKNYWTALDDTAGDPKAKEYVYFDPVADLPPEGQAHWESVAGAPDPVGAPGGAPAGS
jgi:lysine 2,3-aminomutase